MLLNGHLISALVLCSVHGKPSTQEYPHGAVGCIS
jgi:hypothetical protein